MKGRASHTAGLRRAETWQPETCSPVGTAYRRLATVALLLALVVVSLGAYVRLSDAGLGCPDWPGCYGKLVGVPEQAHELAHAEARFGQSVEAPKAWKEMIHRYAAGLLGLAILALAVLAWRQRERRSPWLEVLLLAVVAGQAVLGMLTVTRLLKPVIVTSHLLGGMSTLALLAVLVLRDLAPRRAQPTALPGGLRLLATLALLAIFIQIALGGWVSSNYAAAICADFPTCQGSWWPPMNLREGFTIWRELGMNGDGQPITFAALTGIHYVHRLMAYLVLLALGALAWRLRRSADTRGPAHWLLLLLGLQLLTGLSNVVLDWPLLAAVGHTGGAAALVVVMTGLVAGTRASPSSVGAPSLAVTRTAP